MSMQLHICLLAQTSTINKSSLVSLSFLPVAHLVDDLSRHVGYQHFGKMLSTLVKLLYCSENVKLLNLLLGQSIVHMPFSKFMKHPQTKFHADTISHSEVIIGQK